MKKFVKRLSSEYEKPVVKSVEISIERGFATSSQIDDMFETEGKWEY